MTTLLAYINSTKVAHLTKLTDGKLQFCYDEKWLEQQNAYPISLSLPLQSQLHKGDPVANSEIWNPTSMVQGSTFVMKIKRRKGFGLAKCISTKKGCLYFLQSSMLKR
jgi:HipA-like protein